MDKFVVKTAAVPSKEETRLHLPVNLTAKDRAVKYPEGTFHVDDGLLFCSSCNVVIDHLRKCVVNKHLEAASHKQNVEKNQRSKQQTNFDSLSANRLKIKSTVVMYLTFESHYFSIHAKPVSKFVPIYM